LKFPSIGKSSAASNKNWSSNHIVPHRSESVTNRAEAGFYLLANALQA
jgi:hypothetical protein